MYSPPSDTAPVSVRKTTLLPAVEIHSGTTTKSTSGYLPRPSFHVPFSVRPPPRFRRLLDVHEHEYEPVGLPPLSHSMATISSDAESASDFIMDETFPGSPSSESSMSISSPITSPAGPNTLEIRRCNFPDVTADCNEAATESLSTSSTGSNLIFGWKPPMQSESPKESTCDVHTKRPTLLSGWKPSGIDQTVELLSGDDLPPMSIECSLSLLDTDESMQWLNDLTGQCMAANDSWSSLDLSAGDAATYSHLAMPTSVNSCLPTTQPSASASETDIQLTTTASTSSLGSALRSSQFGTPEETSELASGITKLMSHMIALNQQNAELQQQLVDQREEVFAERESHWTELARAREEAEALRLNALVDSTSVGPMRSPVIPLQAGEIGDVKWTMSLEDLSSFAKDVRQAFASSLAERAKTSENKDVSVLLREVMAEFEHPE